MVQEIKLSATNTKQVRINKRANTIINVVYNANRVLLFGNKAIRLVLDCFEDYLPIVK